VANILEDIAGIDFAAKFIRDVLLKKNITIESTTVKDYIELSYYPDEELCVERMPTEGLDDASARWIIFSKIRPVGEEPVWGSHPRWISIL